MHTKGRQAAVLGEVTARMSRRSGSLEWSWPSRSLRVSRPRLRVLEVRHHPVPLLPGFVSPCTSWAAEDAGSTRCTRSGWRHQFSQSWAGLLMCRWDWRRVIESVNIDLYYNKHLIEMLMYLVNYLTPPKQPLKPWNGSKNNHQFSVKRVVWYRLKYQLTHWHRRMKIKTVFNAAGDLI